MPSQHLFAVIGKHALIIRQPTKIKVSVQHVYIKLWGIHKIRDSHEPTAEHQRALQYIAEHRADRLLTGSRIDWLTGKHRNF
jgi:hypothetical protein